MDFLQYVEPIVKWGPTLLFLLIVLIATFSGFCRGYRKSLIFLIHSVVIGGICIVLFFLFKPGPRKTSRRTTTTAAAIIPIVIFFFIFLFTGQRLSAAPGRLFFRLRFPLYHLLRRGWF